MSLNNIKVVLVGDAAVGKTQLVAQLGTRGSFKPNYSATIGVALLVKKIEGTNIQFWDTAGTDRYHELNKTYLRGAKIVFLCMDPSACTQSSFDKLSNYISEAIPKDALLVLIETKLDLEKERSFFDGNVEAFKREHSIQYHYKTSAKDGVGLDEIDTFFTDFIENMQNSQEATTPSYQSPEQRSVIADIGMDEGTNYSFVFKALTAVAAVAGASLLVAGIVLLSVTTFGIAGIVLAGVGGLMLASSAVGIGFFKYNSCSNPEEVIVTPQNDSSWG